MNAVADVERIEGGSLLLLPLFLFIFLLLSTSSSPSSSYIFIDAPGVGGLEPPLDPSLMNVGPFFFT